MKPAKQKSSAGVPVLDAQAIRRALRRVAHEIIERNARLEKVVLAGIPSRGVEIARRLAGLIREIEKIAVGSSPFVLITLERICRPQRANKFRCACKKLITQPTQYGWKRNESERATS